MAEPIRIGVDEVRAVTDLEAMVANAGTAEAQGLASYWVPQINHTDALTALAVVGSQTSQIELGTAVVPTYPRHPSVLASQALTAQAASGGRIVVGIGLSHQPVIEGAFGYRFERPVGHLREYLEILVPLLRGETVDHHGDHWTFVGTVQVRDAPPPPVVVAALGRQMLAVTGRLADGTITWCTGIKTLRDHIVPRLGDAAAAADRPPPRVIAGLPVCVTDEPGPAREKIGRFLTGYDLLPSYRAMLDLEGADGPADVAIVGDEDEVAAAIGELEAAGVTDLNAAVVPRDREEGRRTTELLARLARRGE